MTERHSEEMANTTKNALVYIPFFGWIIAFAFMLFEKDKIVRWNAVNSLFLHLVVVAVYFIVIPLLKLTVILNPIVSMVSGVVSAGFLIVMLLLAVKAHEGVVTRFPLVSEWVDKLVGK